MFQQQAGQQEVAQVVQREGHLETVGAAPVGQKDGPGIVQQHIQMGRQFHRLGGDATHLALG